MKLLNHQLPDSIRTAGLLVLSWLFIISNAQTIKPQPDSITQWHHDVKYGMFIHWGLYSGPAQGEWYMEKSKIPINSYRKYAFPPTYQREPGDTAYFQADAFLNPSDMQSDWVKFAKAAGMRYMVVTSRHHDGFSLTDSCHPNSFCAGQTLGKDLIAIYRQRCVDAGLRFGFYISCMDWRYPGYFDVYGNNCAPNSWGYTTDPAHKENARQMKEMFYAHVTHVMKKYSPVDYVFWDGGFLGMQGSDADAAFFWEVDKYRSTTNQWQIDEKYAEYDSTVNPPKPLGVMGILRKYSPNVITNPRLGWVGDVNSKEGNFDDNGNIDNSKTWERACNYNVQGGGYSAKWGYVVNDWRPMGYNGLVKALTNAIVRDGNLLLNFGPDRHGNIPKAAVDTVLRMGAWLNKVGDAVYGTRGGPWQPSDNQYGFTSKKDKIFIHIQPGYSGTSFTTPAISGGNNQVNRCYDLNTRNELSFTRNGNGGITINGINRAIHNPNSLVGIYMNGADIDTKDQIVPVKQPQTLPSALQSSKIAVQYSNGKVLVHFTSGDEKNGGVISIYTLQGRRLNCPMVITATDVIINTSLIQSGIYYLKIRQAGGNISISKLHL
jgi:alpha-L-fucosidase